VPVHDLERARVEVLAREIAAAFQRQANGWLAVDITELENIERWRRAARRAGRLLGVHARTGITSDRERVGSLDVGLVRDSVMNATNKLQTFSENWEALAQLGPYSYWITSSLCADGASQLASAIDVCSPEGS